MWILLELSEVSELLGVDVGAAVGGGAPSSRRFRVDFAGIPRTSLLFGVVPATVLQRIRIKFVARIII